MRDEMRSLDELEMGDLWSEARERTPRPHPEPRIPRRPASSRIAAGVVAFAVFIAAGAFAWQALRPAPSTIQASGDGVAGIALWPERTAADLAQVQALADSGDQNVAWRLEPKEVATHFAEDILGWGRPVSESGGTYYQVRLDAGGSPDDSSAVVTVGHLAIPCPSPPPGEPMTCPPPFSGETITLRQLGTAGEGGVWSVTSVVASGLTLRLDPGQQIANNTTLPGSLSFPSTWDAVPGFHAQAGYHVGASGACDVTQTNDAQQGDGALTLVSVDPNICNESTPAGYAWIATGTDVVLAGSAKDPLRFSGNDVGPRFYGLTLVAFTLPLSEPTSSPSPRGIPEQLVGQEWHVTSITTADGSGVQMVKGHEPTLTFTDPTTVGGSTGCNEYGGTVEMAADGTISITDISSTAMGCLGDISTEEAAFVGVLSEVRHYEVLGQALSLSGPAGSLSLSASRTVPDAGCPSPIPSPQPGYRISCEDAVRQAWDAAAYLQSASVAKATQRDVAVAENYAVPAWVVTFFDARYIAGVAGCEETGTISSSAEWAVSAASGRLLGSPPRPHGCIGNEHLSPIPVPYTGTTYTDTAGWQIDVPYGWLTAPVDITRPDGTEVHGVQIMNPIGLDIPNDSVVKTGGSPAHTALVGTYEIGVVIVTDTDPNLPHEPILTPPLDLSNFRPETGAEQNGHGQNAALGVAWVHGAQQDISISAGTGIYAIPDDVMLLNEMLSTFILTSGSG